MPLIGVSTWGVMMGKDMLVNSKTKEEDGVRRREMIPDPKLFRVNKATAGEGEMAPRCSDDYDFTQGRHALRVLVCVGNPGMLGVM